MYNVYNVCTVCKVCPAGNAYKVFIVCMFVVVFVFVSVCVLFACCICFLCFFVRVCSVRALACARGACMRKCLIKVCFHLPLYVSLSNFFDLSLSLFL